MEINLSSAGIELVLRRMKTPRSTKTLCHAKCTIPGVSYSQVISLSLLHVLIFNIADANN
jgi:hypothetical protein